MLEKFKFKKLILNKTRKMISSANVNIHLLNHLYNFYLLLVSICVMLFILFVRKKNCMHTHGDLT